MNSPFSLDINTQQARALEGRGFSISNLSEVGTFLDSIETLGPGSSFSTVVQVLGRGREMVSRYRDTIKVIKSLVIEPKVEPKDA
jgi:hypothetical protein